MGGSEDNAPEGPGRPSWGKAGKRRYPVAIVALAAGLGTRFGGNKLLAEVAGKPLYRHVLDRLRDMPVSAVVLVGRGPEMEQAAKENGFLYVENPRPKRGQSESVRLGLVKALEWDGGISGILFTVCDQPRLTARLFLDILAMAEAGTDRIVCAAEKGRRGSPVYFGRDFFPELTALSGDVGGRAVMRGHPRSVLECPVRVPGELDDIDYRDQLLSAKKADIK